MHVVSYIPDESVLSFSNFARFGVGLNSIEPLDSLSSRFFPLIHSFVPFIYYSCIYLWTLHNILRSIH